MKKVKIHDTDISDFAGKQGYNSEAARYEYLFPLTITYQVANDKGEFWADEERGYRELPSANDYPTKEGKKWATKIADEMVDNFPVWEGDLADIIAYFFEIGWYADYCETVEGGLVFLGCEGDHLDGAKTMKGQTVWTFKQAFDEMKDEDLARFISHQINKNQLLQNA